MKHKKGFLWMVLSAIVIVMMVLIYTVVVAQPGTNVNTQAANQLVARVNSGAVVQIADAKVAMPQPPDVSDANGRRIELSYYLGRTGLFGGKWLIVRADPQTSVVYECYILYD